MFLIRITKFHNMEKYFKRISKPEARHRYWHIHKEDRDFFPESGVPFIIKFHKKEYELKINHKDDIMTGKLYEKYRFLENNEITITKKNDKFELESPDTKTISKHIGK